MLKFLAIFLLSTVALAQDMQHQHSVETCGDQAMGFSHQMTTHHFTLTKDGGRIEVEAEASRSQPCAGVAALQEIVAHNEPLTPLRQCLNLGVCGPTAVTRKDGNFGVLAGQ